MAEWQLPGAGTDIPGAGASDREGRTIVVPVATTAVDQVLLGGDCILMGWSWREATGIAGAVLELFDGGGIGGALLACSDLTGVGGGAATQTPTAAEASGANAIQTASIGGGAGTMVFVTSLRITGLGATAGSEQTAVLSDVQGGNISYPITVPTGAAVPIVPVEDSFGGGGLQAAALGTAIVLTLPAFGAGNTLEAIELQGFVQVAAGTSETQYVGDDGIFVQSGLFLHVVTGSVRGSVWIRS